MEELLDSADSFKPQEPGKSLPNKMKPRIFISEKNLVAEYVKLHKQIIQIITWSGNMQTVPLMTNYLMTSKFHLLQRA